MTTFLSFPIFDWNGSHFLVFYSLALVLMIWWSLSLRERYLNSFNPATDATPELENPIEVAYLAGGASRCTEVAIVSLIESGTVSWEPPRGSGKGRLRATAPPGPECHWLEKSLYSEISLRGAAGMPLSSIGPAVINGVMSLEGRLAKLGLRPTGSEIARTRSSSLLPLIALLVIGILKAVVGLSREQPVGFLLLLLLLTAGAMVFIGFGIGRITPAGQNILNRLKEGRESTGNAGIIGVAVFGVAGASAYADCPQLDSSMIEEFQKSHKLGGSGCGGGGCGTGCSHSGGDGGCSGGGGCGGCGS